MENRTVIKFFFLQGKAPKEIHAILTETLACFIPGQAKDLSAPLYYITHFNDIETRAVIKFFFLQGKAPKEIRAILTETLACFRPGRAKDLSAPLYSNCPQIQFNSNAIHSPAGTGQIGQSYYVFLWKQRVEKHAQSHGLKFATSQNCRYRFAR